MPAKILPGPVAWFEPRARDPLSFTTDLVAFLESHGINTTTLTPEKLSAVTRLIQIITEE